MMMQRQHQITVLACVAALAALGLLLPDPALPDDVDYRRSLQVQAGRIDPETKSVVPPSRTLRAKHNDEAQPADIKRAAPSLLHENPRQNGPTIDVLSIGSETRFGYLQSQVDTWASHANVRNFWGVTEHQDYDVDCPTMSDRDIDTYVNTCRTSTLGTDKRIERWVQKNFATTHGNARSTAGWMCAQRRPGRALGWLQAMYGNITDADLPDMLLLVDDDTSLDVEKMKGFMLRQNAHAPFSSAGCVFDFAGFGFPYGGFGTFVNKAAIQSMTRPIFCDQRNKREEDTEYMRSVCANLQQNRVGELAHFAEGDSVFDLFYKYSAQESFCMHSDWAVGYMLQFYSNGGNLRQIKPRKCRMHPCDATSVTCHEQTPRDMVAFMQAHPQRVAKVDIEVA